MNCYGNTNATRTLVPSLFCLSIFWAASTFASGVLIFSSWDTSEKAEKDVERISGLVEQQATVMEAIVNDRNVFRVVVAVANDEARTTLMQTATDKNLKPWYLKTEQPVDTSNADNTTSTGDSSNTDQPSTSGTPIVLSVNNADPDAVLEYLDKATIESTIEKLDAVRQRAQDLIPGFEPRAQELPPSDPLPDTPDSDLGTEDEPQVGTSDTAETPDTE